MVQHFLSAQGNRANELHLLHDMSILEMMPTDWLGLASCTVALAR